MREEVKQIKESVKSPFYCVPDAMPRDLKVTWARNFRGIPYS